MKHKLFAGIVFALSLTACSPVFKNLYSYTPPKSNAGIKCVSKCDSSKSECVTRQMEQYNNCKIQQSSIIQACKGQHALQKAAYLAANPGPLGQMTYYDESGDCAWSGPSCNYPDNDACENLYSLCYKNCGGQVKTTTQCIRYCKN